MPFHITAQLKRTSALFFFAAQILSHALPATEPQRRASILRVREVPLGEFNDFWRTKVMPANWLSSESWLVSSSNPLMGGLDTLLPWPRPVPNAILLSPFADEIVTVRLLGGWANASGLPEYEQDLIAMDASSRFTYRWHLLRERLDPVVSRGLRPLIVLDNVPFAFVTHPQFSQFGQSMGPDSGVLWGSFVRQVCEKLVEFYGVENVSQWRYRIGTEPDCPCHWNDSMEKYIETYTRAARAIRRILPEAKIGPGNFSSLGVGGNFNVQTLVNQLRAQRLPIDFLSASVYGIYSSSQNDHYSLYRPTIMRQKARFLKTLRDTLPNRTSTSIEFHEFGLLVNELTEESPEPGSYGAAWTGQAWIHAMDEGISRIAHWQNFDNVLNSKLLWGSGWLMAMAQKWIGATTRLLQLTTNRAQSGTSIMGLLINKPNQIHILVSAFNTDRRVSNSERISVDIETPEIIQQNWLRSNLRVYKYELGPQNSVFDIIYSELRAREGHLKPGVGINRLNGRNNMATATGLEYVRRNLERYLTIQNHSLRSSQFHEDIRSESNRLRLWFWMNTPSLVIISLEPTS